MECKVCLEEFNATERRPKVLPCGHSYCLRCLKGLTERICPTDRKAFTAHPDNLVDNFQILDVSESLPPKLWCCSCQKEATSKECKEWHTLCSIKKARTEQASPLLLSLKTAMKETSDRLGTMAKVRDLVLEHYSRLEKAQERLHKAHKSLQSAIETDTEDMIKAMTAVKQALDESVPAKACPSAIGGVCKVKMTQNTKTWRANLYVRDGMVDQIFQGLNILTEGELNWQFESVHFSSGSAPPVSARRKTDKAVPVFGATIPSVSVPTAVPSTGIFGSGSAPLPFGSGSASFPSTSLFGSVHSSKFGFSSNSGSVSFGPATSTKAIPSSSTSSAPASEAANSNAASPAGPRAEGEH